MDGEIRQQGIPFDINNNQRSADDWSTRSYFQNNSQQFHQEPMMISSNEMNDNYFVNANDYYNMNQYPPNEVINRGISPNRYNSRIDVKQPDQSSMYLPLDNIKNKNNLSRNPKLQELQRKRTEDQKYIRHMVNSYPFGRGGGGAPIRNKNGDIIAIRKSLISDPKYNHASINVVDDYNDVWRKDKYYGLVNFVNSPIISNNQSRNNNNIIYPQTHRNSNTIRFIPNKISINNCNQSIPMENHFNYNNNIYDNNQQFQYYRLAPKIQQSIYNSRNYSVNNRNYGNRNMNMNMNMNNINSYNQIQNRQKLVRSFSTPMSCINNTFNDKFNFNQSITPQYNDNQRLFSTNISNNQNNQSQQLKSNNNPEVFPPFYDIQKTELNLSYDNYGLNQDNKKKNMDTYKRELLSQINNDLLRKSIEKKRKKLEDMKEEERVERENNEIRMLIEKEKYEKKMKEMEAEFDNKNEEKNKKLREQQGDQKPSSSLKKDKSVQINQRELESRKELKFEIDELKKHMRLHQSGIYDKIKEIKDDAKQAISQREEALNEITFMRKELEKQRKTHMIRCKYVYDVINEDKNEVSKNYIKVKPQDPNNKKQVSFRSQSTQNIYGKDKHSQLNSNDKIPKPDDLKTSQIITGSKFYDINSSIDMSGHIPFEAKLNSVPEESELNKINYHESKLYDDDFKQLKDYYKNQSNRTKIFGNNKVNSNNENEKNDVTLDINEIINKNVFRLNYLNEIGAMPDFKLLK